MGPLRERRERPVYGMGFTNRPHRRARRREQLRGQLRPGACEDEGALEIATEDALRRELAHSGNPHALKWFEKTAPSSRAPVLREFFEDVQASAIRELPEARALGELLTTAPRGRPT